METSRREVGPVAWALFGSGSDEFSRGGRSTVEATFQLGVTTHVLSDELVGVVDSDHGLKTSMDWPPTLRGAVAVNVTDETRFGIPAKEHLAAPQSAAPASNEPERPSGPVTMAVHVRPSLVESAVRSLPGRVVVVVVLVVVVLDVVVVDEVVVVVPLDDTAKPRSLVVRSDVLAKMNSEEAEVPWSLGPAIPDWNVYPHEFTEKTGPSPVDSFIG